ncbi:hypothetical protein OIO90_003968 [Microbotryomycetes sp. JL221]|nr:hypothetical protein OIO90_003968 [Microbotryomycetes sp. JL221]
MPLGRLSPAALANGEGLLNQLASTPAAKKKDIVLLTNQYYTCIPHSFARGRPPLLSSPEQIHQEFQLLDALESFKSNQLSTNLCTGIESHPLDMKYQNLGLNLRPSCMTSYLCALDCIGQVVYRTPDVVNIARQNEKPSPSLQSGAN